MIDRLLNARRITLRGRSRRGLFAGRRGYGGGALKIDAAAWEKRLRTAGAATGTMLVIGPQSLSAETMKDLLSGLESMLWLHCRAWLRSSDRTAPVWRNAIREKRSGKRWR